MWRRRDHLLLPGRRAAAVAAVFLAVFDRGDRRLSAPVRHCADAAEIIRYVLGLARVYNSRTYKG